MCSIYFKRFFYHCFFSEESGKPDSDLDEPWIMTVKGPHSIKPPPVEESNAVNKKVHNGSGPPQTKSVHKDSNLNHYRTDKNIPVSINFIYLSLLYGFIYIFK